MDMATNIVTCLRIMKLTKLKIIFSDHVISEAHVHNVLVHFGLYDDPLKIGWEEGGKVNIHRSQNEHFLYLTAIISRDHQKFELNINLRRILVTSSLGSHSN
jgi:hypothetical protein